MEAAAEEVGANGREGGREGGGGGEGGGGVSSQGGRLWTGRGGVVLGPFRGLPVKRDTRCYMMILPFWGPFGGQIESCRR
jgi:hypothetical protein